MLMGFLVSVFTSRANFSASISASVEKQRGQTDAGGKAAERRGSGEIWRRTASARWSAGTRSRSRRRADITHGNGGCEELTDQLEHLSRTSTIRW